MSVFKVSESSGEVEVLMERMKQLQECRDEEEASQEEMATRFEREKTESMLVVTSGKWIYDYDVKMQRRMTCIKSPCSVNRG